VSVEFHIREDRLNGFMSDFICGAVDLYDNGRILHTFPFRLPAIWAIECNLDGLQRQLRRETEQIMRRVAQSYMATTRGLTSGVESLDELAWTTNEFATVAEIAGRGEDHQ
jgi:hypothetical protein